MFLLTTFLPLCYIIYLQVPLKKEIATRTHDKNICFMKNRKKRGLFRDPLKYSERVFRMIMPEKMKMPSPNLVLVPGMSLASVFCVTTFEFLQIPESSSQYFSYSDLGGQLFPVMKDH